MGNERDFEILEGELVKYHGDGGEVIIPDGVTKICMDAFYKSGVSRVVIPYGVKCIGERAFKYCLQLESVVIPGTVKSIRQEAFYHCEALREIEIPNGVTSIGDSAFLKCVSLVRLEVPDTVKRIGLWTFFECENLKYLRLPKKLNDKINLAFYYDGYFPEVIVTSVDNFGYFVKRFLPALVRGSLYLWKRGELSRVETEKLADYIKGNLMKVFGALSGYLPLYEFMTSVGKIPSRNVDKLVEKTGSTECRALLFYYKQGRRKIEAEENF